MRNLAKLSIVAMIVLNLQAQEQQGLSQEQLGQIKAIMQQTQELVNEQQQNQSGSMGESIYNDKDTNINRNVKTSIGVNPLGLFGKGEEHAQVTNLRANGQIPKEEYIDFENSVPPPPREYGKEELELMQSAIRTQDLKALQKKFHSKKYSGYENTTIISYTQNKTHKIRTRHAMATTLIFDSPIENFILGDQTGFKLELIPNKDDAIAVIPQLIGIDTSLTIFTKDSKIHTFYLFSTDYRNTNDPSFVIYIKDEEAIRAKQAKIERDNRDYKIIKDGIAELKIKKSNIYSGYVQKAEKENEWLLSAEIFDDKKFTYFKYPKDEMPQVPAIFAVIDNQDSPVETRVIGDYIVAETINPRFTIKSGNSYICVGRQETDAEKERKEIRKNLNKNNEKKTDSQFLTPNKEKQNDALKKLRGF
ncbi:TrbG/VirB9 family P-type conjugative transfer protein [Campylobacter fetus subsp. venerealis]|uniref:TrbG/VirB9 family P-type conjugative transfer protein n=1 Tax=Campylobacter fetus TaxID=196 RepID=UPI0008188DC6|nr:TrbG/VirB9 family P-type conjugative transfer protein [Campylobacter fetus]MBK3498172.1 TrbG/VirB9 family P-type conjugative transfer protein [Campylobacter fetus subsp. venerealis]MBK3502196.1 TrbG/VirB9 family P-type conjugative transfer protein [Campylobacter fetus subsp. venerealis]OCS16808.1 type IV secretion system protein VirB9 [Campylobacter fetus subsp. venerealis]